LQSTAKSLHMHAPIPVSCSVPPQGRFSSSHTLKISSSSLGTPMTSDCLHLLQSLKHTFSSCLTDRWNNGTVTIVLLLSVCIIGIVLIIKWSSNGTHTVYVTSLTSTSLIRITSCHQQGLVDSKTSLKQNL